MMRDIIENTIRETVAEYNRKYNMWGEPIIGFAEADSEYIRNIRGVTSEDHVAIKEAMPWANTVISYYVPFKREINETNMKAGLSSETWARSYEVTNAMFPAINERIIATLKSHGKRGEVPREAGVFDREKLISYYSQRHMAYAAGLGTFGMNNMLITPAGCCGRFSSVISDVTLKWDVPLKEELCLYKREGSCGVCMKVCEAKALGENDFDRKACYKVCSRNAEIYTFEESSYGGGAGSEVCGKCISLSPCAFMK